MVPERVRRRLPQCLRRSRHDLHPPTGRLEELRACIETLAVDSGFSCSRGGAGSAGFNPSIWTGTASTIGRDPATIQATLHRRHLSAAYQAKDTSASARARRPRCCRRRRRFLRPAPAKHMGTAHALPTTTLPAPSIPAANTRTTRSVHGYLFIFRGADKLGLFDRTCIRQGDRERCSIQWLDGPRRRGGLVDDLVVGRLRGA